MNLWSWLEFTIVEPLLSSIVKSYLCKSKQNSNWFSWLQCYNVIVKLCNNADGDLKYVTSGFLFEYRNIFYFYLRYYRVSQYCDVIVRLTLYQHIYFMCLLNFFCKPISKTIIHRQRWLIDVKYNNLTRKIKLTLMFVSNNSIQLALLIRRITNNVYFRIEWHRNVLLCSKV